MTGGRLLKAYTINGPARFDATPVVWVRLQCTLDTLDLLGEFLRFLLKAEIYTAIHAGSSGGGQFQGAFAPDDAERVVAWLREHGAAEDVA